MLLHKFVYFKGLCLFFLSIFPEAMFIQGATSIPEFRVMFSTETFSDFEIKMCSNILSKQKMSADANQNANL